MIMDLNADLGEGYGIWRLGDDEALLDLVTSANVACGFHAGDPLTIRRTCAAAVERGVAIGAQVSYRDLAGFGRREMDVDPEELHAEILYQLAAVDGIARAVGGEVSYVKPHGALYNRVCRDAGQAEALVTAVAAYRRELPVLTLPGSVVHEVARPTAGVFRIGHPGGVQELEAVVRRQDDGTWHVERVSSYRTARAIMGGELIVPPSYSPRS